jgi:hypothetical protein
MDRTQYQITGSATNTVQGFIVGTAYLSSQVGSSITATTSATAFGAGSSITAGSQFPSANQMDDINIVAASILVSYLGSPLNATGEIILGNVANDSSQLGTATYNGLYYYPGFLKVPIATLIDKPLRCFLTKSSPVADQFATVGNSNVDCNKPIIVTSGMVAGALLNCEVTRTFEYRSTVTTALVVPYEISAASMSTDVSQYQDGIAELARLPASVEEGASEYVREAALGLVGSSLAPYLTYGATAMLGMARNRMHAHFAANRGQLNI